MGFQIYNEKALAWCNGAPDRVCAWQDGLSDLGVAPLVYAAVAGAAAAGGLVASWLTKEDWSVGEYNAYMNQAYNTILLWDDIGWRKGCWNDATRRARWKLFMNAFGKHYGEHGKISGASFVSDSEEKPARDLIRQLAAWQVELNDTCSANIPDYLPPPPPKPTDPTDYLKVGSLLVGGFLVLQIIGAFRGATASNR